MPARSAALALVGLLAAAPALAQDRVARIMPVLDTAIEEWRVFLNCSALDPEAHAFHMNNWRTNVEGTSAFLYAQGFAGSVVIPFATRARPEALMLPGDTPFAEVRAFCDAHPEWRWQLDSFGFTMLPDALEQALAE